MEGRVPYKVEGRREFSLADHCSHEWAYHHFQEAGWDGEACHVYYCRRDPRHMLRVPIKEVEWIG